MANFTQSAAGWGLHTAAAGAGVFGLGWLGVCRVVDPARRQKLGGWVVRGGLLAAVLCLFPAWLLLPAPRWAEPGPAQEIPTAPDCPKPVEEKPAADLARPVP